MKKRPLNAESFDSGRALSIRAPITNEEERAQFQQRLGLFALVVFVLALGFFLVATISTLIVAPGEVLTTWRSPTTRVQLTTTFFALAGWALTRFGARSASGLAIADAVTTIGICTGWCLMSSFDSPSIRPELTSLLACSFTVSMRAALLPSTPLRTALFTTVGLLPLIVITHVRRAGVFTQTPLAPVVYASIWVLLTICASTTTTWVTFGLRLQVRKAMQLGQYLLDEKIGEGGMGAVYRAHHALLRRPTAVKLLSSGDEKAIKRFEREVQTTAALTHPNTIAVFDYGRTPDGVFYYAMEHLDGVTLQDLVKQAGRQSPARVVHLLLQICGTLEEAHAAGLVHRDIKPANVMLTTRGGIVDFVKVLDFGLVKEIVGPTNLALTGTSAILGTPHYMAPESIMDPDAIDGRADIYAVGATAYYMLTGSPLFEGANLIEIFAKHVHDPAPAPSAIASTVPPRLDELVLACLAKKAEDRPKDATKLIELLRDCGAAPWTQADARAWWSEHRAIERCSTSSLGDSNTGLTTMTVAVADRGHSGSHASSLPRR